MMGIVAYLVFFAIVVLVLGVATLGLNLQWGTTGLFNAGVVGFYGVGGYTQAILTAPGRPELLGNFGLPWLVGVAGAMAASAIAAVIVGIATVRLRGDYLAIATFGIAVALQLVALNWERLTGGSLGLTSVPRPLASAFEGSLRLQSVLSLPDACDSRHRLRGVGTHCPLALGAGAEGST